MTQKRVVPIDGSTVSHHAIITLAIRLSCSAVASRSSHCQASSGGYSKRWCSIVSSLGHDRPSDARHLVGNGNSDEHGWLLGQLSCTRFRRHPLKLIQPASRTP